MQLRLFVKPGIMYYKLGLKQIEQMLRVFHLLVLHYKIVLIFIAYYISLEVIMWPSRLYFERTDEDTQYLF